MRKILFVDRDGTLVIEPKENLQLDALEKLTFYPGVFTNLAKIVQELNYELVMVTNQDGLGTASFPEETFWPAQHKIIQAFENEGIHFTEILIDRSFELENKPTRKPGKKMIEHYLKGSVDLSKSFVIGDRLSDMQLAENIGCRGVFLSDSPVEIAAMATTKWSDVYAFLAKEVRKSKVIRVTSETQIQVALDLEGTGESEINTGIGFFDHMLTQIARHGAVDLSIKAKGDLFIDEHHTIEDVGICLGQAFRQALGDKRGIERYGFLLPMDESLAQVAIDFGGRPDFVWKATFKREKIGEMPTEMFPHFFKSFADYACCNLNIQVEGENEHHKIEAIFKAFAKALKMAIRRTGSKIPSTKGSL